MKKTIAFVLALVMLLSLTACSGNTTQSPAEGTQPSSAPVEKTETGESGKDEFVIGMYNVMSGANAIYGEEAQNALKMVVDKMNAEGGINGATVRYVVYDDQGSPEEAVKVVTKLIEVDKVDACITSCISSAVLATGEALNKAEIVSFGTGLSPTYMAQGWEYLFRACVNSDYTTPKAVELAKDLGVS
ncbi:MAG: ABC transporter substrate-binding protein, partial [Candidatus Faecousia sp.]|nr:ABC transporter substrate-binding protein [Candidatus Faecousia sp.]